VNGAATGQVERSNADIFIPQQWVFPDELHHHANAGLILQDLNFNSRPRNNSSSPVKVLFSPIDDLRNSIKQDGT